MNNSEIVPLEPCPYCGGTRIENNRHIRDGRKVQCRDCGASVYEFEPKANERSIAKWNNREALAVLTTSDLERIYSCRLVNRDKTDCVTIEMPHDLWRRCQDAWYRSKMEA